MCSTQMLGSTRAVREGGHTRSQAAMVTTARTLRHTLPGEWNVSLSSSSDCTSQYSLFPQM